MKISFILSKCHFYGSSKNVLEVSKHLSKWGHETHIFANTWDPIGGVFFHKIPSIQGPFSIREGFTTIYESLKIRGNKFGIKISQPGRYFTPDVAHVRFLEKKAIEYRKSIGEKTPIATKIVSKIEKYNLRKCKKIISMSNHTKEDIINFYGIPSEKIEVVYDGINIEKFNPKNKKKHREEIRNMHKISKNDFVVLFVGNPFERKGLKYLIEAVSFIKEDVKILVLGNDDINPYVDMAKKLGVDNEIIYAGFSKEVYKYFNAADIFVFPTLYEPFGLVITEAMASGLPVVTSRIAGASELIDEYKTGFLLNNPKDSKEISEKIEFLLNNPSHMRKIGRNAAKKMKKYTWKKTAKDMLKVFEEVKLLI